MEKYKCVDGTVVWVTKRLKYMPTAQSGVIIDEHHAIHLISYTTPVVNIDPMGWLTCNGTFSATTRKHIGAFMKEYAPNFNYHTCKNAYENKYTINIYTGEIVFL